MVTIRYLNLAFVLVPLTTLGGIFGVDVFCPPYFKQSKQHKVIALFFVFFRCCSYFNCHFDGYLFLNHSCYT